MKYFNTQLIFQPKIFIFVVIMTLGKVEALNKNLMNRFINIECHKLILNVQISWGLKILGATFLSYMKNNNHSWKSKKQIENLEFRVSFIWINLNY